MTRPSRVMIDLAALRHNFLRVKALAPHSKIMAIIKADAYGHGLIRVAKTLSDADAFGVACIEEAEQLRAAAIPNRIVLLEGQHQSVDLTRIVELDFEIVLHHELQLQQLEKAKLAHPLKVWVKIDTGMHRLGFAPDKIETMLNRIEHCANIQKPVILMTHLATANEPAHPLTKQQIDCFETICSPLQLEQTIANSAAIMADPKTHQDWVRPGLMLYGVCPLRNQSAMQHGLKPVMTLESEIISIKYLNKNDLVGYGATWRCPENMPAGIVAAGYGDGFPRHAKSGTPVLVNDMRSTLIGRASMDMLTIDLRNQTSAAVGDRVVLWGESLAIEEIAEYADTIPYQLLCGVHKRLQFIERF